MGQELLPSDRAVHSDFLIHWTGKDIDAEVDPNWFGRNRRSKTSEAMTTRYLERLRDILRYGLWMTEEDAGQIFATPSGPINVPPTPQVCFTELKLSESRRHAHSYGRLGIGVKRPFLFHRFGRPLTYVGFSPDRHKDKFLEACAADLKDKRLLNYFKPMNADYRDLRYELYSESEWRVLLFNELVEEGKLIDPRDPENSREHAYFNSLTPGQRDKLKFLIPLDGWLAMIIYPSLQTKNIAQWDDSLGIRDEIKRIKTADAPGNGVEGMRDPIRGNWPIEVNLDACAHF